MGVQRSASSLNAISTSPAGSLGPGVHKGPGQCAGEGGVHIHAKVAAGLGGQHHLINGPLGARLWVAVYFGRSEGIKHGVVGRMHGDELPLKVGREFGDFHSRLLRYALKLVAVILAVGGFFEINAAGVKRGYLYALIANIRHPLASILEGVERELRRS